MRSRCSNKTVTHWGDMSAFFGPHDTPMCLDPTVLLVNLHFTVNSTATPVSSGKSQLQYIYLMPTQFVFCFRHW